VHLPTRRCVEPTAFEHSLSPVTAPCCSCHSCDKTPSVGQTLADWHRTLSTDFPQFLHTYVCHLSGRTTSNCIHVDRCLASKLCCTLHQNSPAYWQQTYTDTDNESHKIQYSATQYKITKQCTVSTVGAINSHHSITSAQLCVMANILIFCLQSHIHHCFTLITSNTQ